MRLEILVYPILSSKHRDSKQISVIVLITPYIWLYYLVSEGIGI